MIPIVFNPELDLKIERVVDAPASEIWKAWTTPELLMPWFCPRPWSVSNCSIDLRPGGRFDTTMRSPEGEAFPNKGCYLEVIPCKRLVWTSALQNGWRPAADNAIPGHEGSFHFTAVLEFEDLGGRTRYTATVLHGTTAAAKKHEAMGYVQGWNIALDQLLETIKKS